MIAVKFRNRDVVAIAYTATNYADLLTKTGMLEGDLAIVYNAQGVWPINRKLSGVYIYGSGTWTYGTQEMQNILQAKLDNVIAGANINIDYTNPLAPIINASLTAAGIVDNIIAGENIVVNNTDPVNPIVSNKGSNFSLGTYFKLDSVLTATLPGGPGTTQNVNPIGWQLAGVIQATVLNMTIIGPGNATWGGLLAPSPAQDNFIIIYNADDDNIILSNQDAGSLAVNRFSIQSNVTLQPSESLALWYNIAISRWVPFSKF